MAVHMTFVSLVVFAVIMAMAMPMLSDPHHQLGVPRLFGCLLLTRKVRLRHIEAAERRAQHQAYDQAKGQHRTRIESDQSHGKPIDAQSSRIANEGVGGTGFGGKFTLRKSGDTAGLRPQITVWRLKSYVSNGDSMDMKLTPDSWQKVRPRRRYIHHAIPNLAHRPTGSSTDFLRSD